MTVTIQKESVMNIAMIFAGGTGIRMGAKAIPKQFLELYNKPVIIYTLEKFENNDNIDGIVISCLESWIPRLKKMILQFHITKVTGITAGGSTGQESIYNGLRKVKELYPFDDTVVLVHDGVRPMVDSDTIDENIRSVRTHGSAITITPAAETIIQENTGHMIETIIDRKECRLARAPQSFYLKDILDAHTKAAEDNLHSFIDSATMMQHYGHTLYTVTGPVNNIKITTPVDFYIFKALLDAENSMQAMG